MKPRYLNEYARKEIEVLIKLDVWGKIEKSEVGKELRVLEKRIVKAVRKLITSDTPEEELKVLKKYGFTTNHDRVSLYLDKNDNLQDLWYGRQAAFSIDIKPPVMSVKAEYPNQFIVKKIREDDVLLQACVTAFKMNDHLKCELNETVNAYMTRVRKFRTVKTLLAAHPGMKKFIPKQSVVKAGPPPKPEQKDEDKRIALFEASI